LKFSEPEPLKKVFYSLSGEMFENKVKLDFLNPFTNQYLYRIFGFGSINGIFCLHEYDDLGKITLWNPATQEIKLIPPSPVVESFIPDLSKDFVNLVCFSNLHGFGYDSVIDDYKVIRFVCFFCDINEPLEDIQTNVPLLGFWEMYSLRSNSWRNLNVDMPSSMYCMDGTQVYMDGVCHWLCGENCPAELCMVSFYLSNEKFVITPIPLTHTSLEEDDCSTFKVSWINLVVLNGSIALISFNEETTTFHISILGELSFEESWTKLFIVGPLSCVDRPIGLGTKGEIFFKRNDSELVWLDLYTQMIEEVGFKEGYYISRIMIYKESIQPIGEISN
jgi:molecular chaperone HtpG